MPAAGPSGKSVGESGKFEESTGGVDASGGKRPSIISSIRLVLTH